MLLRLSPGSQVPKSQVAKYKLVTPLQNYHHRGNKRMESNYLPQVCILLHCLCSRLWWALQDPGHHCLSRFSLFFASLPGEYEEPHPTPHFLQLAGFHSECPDFYTTVPLVALSQCDCYISGVTPRYNEPVKPGGASSPVLCLDHLYLAPTFLIDVSLLPILQGVRVNDSSILQFMVYRT